MLALTACRGAEGPPVRVTIPSGSSFTTAVDSLAARGVVGNRQLFRAYARARGATRSIQPGTYELPRNAAFGVVLAKLRSGDVLRVRVTVPEGWTTAEIAPRIAAVTPAPRDSVLALLLDSASAKRFSVPGPTLEGYLYPATYSVPAGTPPARAVRLLTERYRRVWTPALRARADSLGMTEREVVTLASIVEKEAKHWDERPTIAAVYQNRLRTGMRLQADPTVQYARGAHTARLLYADIRAVRDNPYNTYAHAGLPPGPIASPSEGAIRAALYPAQVPFLYFVARPDGRHVFTTSLAAHNQAKRTARRAAGGGG